MGRVTTCPALGKASPTNGPRLRTLAGLCKRQVSFDAKDLKAASWNSGTRRHVYAPPKALLHTSHSILIQFLVYYL